MSKAVSYLNRPAPGTTLTWGDVTYTVFEVDRGVLYGKHYDRIHWRSRCVGECGCVVKQTSSLSRPWLRKRCDDCDPGGALDKADRQVFIATKGRGVAKMAARRTDGASELDALREEIARLQAQLAGAPVVPAAADEDAAGPTWRDAVKLVGVKRLKGRATYSFHDAAGRRVGWLRADGEPIPLDLQHMAEAIESADLIGGDR